jgi:hypothetical protein
MASHPGFDANLLDEQWSSLIQDERAPLLNRAVLGRYPSGKLASTLFPEGLPTFGLDRAIELFLPSGAQPDTDLQQPDISPLQAALVTAALSADGVRPAPTLVSAVITHAAGWVLLPGTDAPVQAISPGQAAARTNPLISDNSSIWEYTTEVQQATNQPVNWYVAGTTPEWGGPPMALALVLEEGDPQLAAQIGRSILQTALR